MVLPGLSRCATIYSDCLGALGRVSKLPPYRIPSQCWHSDTLKTIIMVNCTSLLFQLEYNHVAAHQDDHTRWEDLTRATQLNSACNTGAKANTTLSGCDKSSPTGGIPAQTYLHVCRRKEDDFGYGCAHRICSRTSSGTVLLSQDRKDVSRHI